MDKDNFKVGQYIIYHNKSTDHYELGRIKSLCDDGAFVAYCSGETGAKTPYDMMHQLANAYTIEKTLLGSKYFENSSLEELFEHYISDCWCDTQVFDKADDFISIICKIATKHSFDRALLWETWTERKIRR